MTLYLQNQQSTEYLEFDQLYAFAHGVFPEDDNFALWAGKTLFRDRTFYRLFPVKSERVGRPFELDIRHKETGKTRDQWAIEISTRGHLHRWSELQEPKLWVIGKESLIMQYPLLYVDHDEHWRCEDGVNHDRYRYTMPRRDVDRLLASLPADADRHNWHEQAQTQDINPCVFALIHWWVSTLPTS